MTAEIKPSPGYATYIPPFRRASPATPPPPSEDAPLLQDRWATGLAQKTWENQLTQNDRDRMLTAKIMHSDRKRLSTLSKDCLAFNSEHWGAYFNRLSQLFAEKGSPKKAIVLMCEQAAEKLLFAEPRLSSGALAQIIRVAGHHQLQTEGFADFLFAAAKPYARNYTEKEVYMLCSGLREWEIASNPKNLLIGQLQQNWFDAYGNARPHLGSYSPQALAAIYRLLANESPQFNGKKALTEIISSRLKEFNARCITEILSGMATHKKYHPDFLIALAEQAKQDSPTLTGRGYSNLLNELANLNFQDVAWYEQIVDHLSAQPEKFELYEQVLIVCAIARTGHNTDRIKDLALKLAANPELATKCYRSDVALFTLVCGFLFGKAHQRISHTLIKSIPADELLDEQSRSQIYQAMILTGFPRNEALSLLKSVAVLPPLSSQFQEKVTAQIKERLKESGIRVFAEAPIGNTFVDLLVKGVKFDHKKIVIQIDGPFHDTIPTLKPTMSTLVNTTILQELGYYVIRIHHRSWEEDVQDTVNFLQDPRLRALKPKSTTAR